MSAVFRQGSIAENSVINRTFCKIHLGSLVMHSISKLPSRKRGCGLWRGAEQGPPPPELCDAPCEDTWPRAALPWGIPQQAINLCQKQDWAAFQTVDLGWGSRFKVWAWDLWLNNSLAKKRSPVHPDMLHFSVILALIGVLVHFHGILVQHLACSLCFCFLKCTAAISFISFADLCNSLRQTWIFGGINPCILSQYFNVHLHVIFYFRNICEYFGVDLNAALR